MESKYSTQTKIGQKGLRILRSSHYVTLQDRTGTTSRELEQEQGLSRRAGVKRMGHHAGSSPAPGLGGVTVFPQPKLKRVQFFRSLRVKAGHLGNDNRYWKTGAMIVRGPRAKPNGQIMFIELALLCTRHTEHSPCVNSLHLNSSGRSVPTIIILLMQMGKLSYKKMLSNLSSIIVRDWQTKLKLISCFPSL